MRRLRRPSHRMFQTRSCALLVLAIACGAATPVFAQPRATAFAKVGGRIRAEPLIDKGGSLYVASDDGTVRALTPRGAARYVVQTGSRVRATPVLDEGG